MMCLHMIVFAYYVITLLYWWNVLIDDEHQILERHCLTCHSHTSDIEQDTGYKRYINLLLLYSGYYSESK